MGKVKDKYIQYAEAVDQYVGHVIAGLPVLNAKYACTPPYFQISNCADVDHVDDTCSNADVDSGRHFSILHTVVMSPL